MGEQLVDCGGGASLRMTRGTVGVGPSVEGADAEAPGTAALSVLPSSRARRRFELIGIQTSQRLFHPMKWTRRSRSSWLPLTFVTTASHHVRAISKASSCVPTVQSVLSSAVEQGDDMMGSFRGIDMMGSVRGIRVRGISGARRAASIPAGFRRRGHEPHYTLPSTWKRVGARTLEVRVLSLTW